MGINKTQANKHTPPSSVATVSLKLSTGNALVNTTGPGYKNFTTSVSPSVTSLTVTATATDPTATITVNMQSVTSGMPSQSIPLNNTGTTPVTIVGTAQDGTTRTYIITVSKSGSNNPDVSIKLNSTSLLVASASGPADVNYTTSVSSTTTSLSLTPTTADPTATIKVNNSTVASGYSSPAIPLNPTGTTLINVEGFAQDGVTTKTYSITVSKNGVNNANLSFKLSTNTNLVLTGTSGSTVNYTTSVAVATTSLTITPTASAPSTTIKVNNISVVSGTASQSIALNATGTTTITAEGFAQDGTTRTYIITVSKTGSNNANLTLKLSTGTTLVATTGTSDVNYSTSVGVGTSSITVTPTAADANATITVNGTAVASGMASQSVALSSNPTVINVLVKAQDGVTQKSYSITVNKSGSNVATLRRIVLSTGSTLSPTTGSADYNYTASVSNSTTSLTVTPTATDATATITVNGTQVASGTASQSIALTANPTVINMRVVAQDGVTTKTYSITVNKSGSNEATLSSIVLNPASTLVASTGSSDFNYTTSVSNTTTSVTITPTAADPNAVIKMGATVIASGTASPVINLNAVGTTTVNLMVTAQDGVTTKTYAITISKSGSNDALLKSISLSTNTTKVAAATGPADKNYTTSVPSNTASMTVTPTAEDINASITVNGMHVNSVSPSQSISLPTNTTVIIIDVTAQDGVTKESYSITVNKNGSNIATLKKLTVSTGTLTLTPGTTDYTTSVSLATTSLTVTPTATDANATILVNGQTVTSGTASSSINLTPGGSTTINILVTAQDGTTTKFYSIQVKRTGQNSYTWTGAADNKWSNDNNWSPTGHPVAGDEAIIGTTATPPTVDVTSACSDVSITGSTTITLNAPLNVSASTDLNSNLTIAGTAAFNGAILSIAGSNSNYTFTVNTGATANFTKIDLLTNAVIANHGTLTANADVTVGYLAGIANYGTFTTTGSSIDVQTNAFINNVAGAVLNITNSPSFSLAYLARLGNVGITHINGSTIHMGNTGYIENSPGATFTIDGNSIVDFAANSAASSKIQNDGTFFAGTVNSPVTINLNYPGALLQNTSNFTLAIGSVINMPADNAQLSNSGTFTLLSDVTGSATIGPVTGNSAHIDGNYDVQRFISGTGTDANGGRGYRLLSSPVYATTNSVGNIYSLNYAALGSPVVGSGGIAGGFDASGNPTIYLFRGNLPQSNATFTSGNFRGVAAINNAPNYTLDGDGGPFNIPVGNGFLFFFRGSRVNLSSKLQPGAVADNSTYNEVGKLNVGAITVKPWFTGLSTLDYSFHNTNGTEFALVGNPYASSIDWDKYSTSSSTAGIYAPNVGPFIYIIQGSSGNYNVYQAGNFGVGTVAGSGSNVIPSGQGFFVEAESVAAALTFNETGKINTQVAGANGNLFLGKPMAAVTSQYLNLRLLKDTALIDGITVKFNSVAKPEFVPGEDARYLLGNGLARLSSRSADNIELAVNAMALPQKSATIPLTVTAVNDGQYQIKMATLKSIPELYDVWLMDAYKKDSVNMRQMATYSFALSNSDAASFGTGRFSLVIRQNPLLAMRLLNFTASKATVGANVVWKTINEENYTNFTVERSTDNGATFEVLGGYLSSNLGSYSFLDHTPIRGINLYRLKLEDLNGFVTYSSTVKLMVANGDNGLAASSINIYPNPSNGVINLSINQSNVFASDASSPVASIVPVAAVNTSGSEAYIIKIVNITGSVIKTATSSSANWQDNVGSLAPGTYFIQVTNKKDNSLVGKSSFVKY